ncbi:hypothetical protein AB0O34_01355 [Sphaerisporangium sp. NPDC088356]|uniref:hypothetical protein n=1 Tax=Sphaerisporangium sp. NPDC088356 TaxID=3154871 RepID=UPI00343BB134
MSLDALAKPGISGGRFLLVDYLPTYAASLMVLVLVWAGAPGRPVDFGRAWRTAAGLRTGEVVLLGVAITLLAVLGTPLQLALVRLLEGEWPPAGLARRSRARQGRLRARLASAEELPESQEGTAEGQAGTVEGQEGTAEGPAAGAETYVAEAGIQAAGVAGTRLRRLYPPAELLRPTALGNVLAATESQAGEPYGLDAVVAWPRLYPLLGENVKAVVDDRRDILDTSARLSVTMAATAVVAGALLARSGWWLLLALVPLVIARVAYVGAVHAAVAYGEAVRAAIDLHRFTLVDALRLPLPRDPDDEHRRNTYLCDLWRQGIPMPPEPYRHPSPPDDARTSHVDRRPPRRR